MDGEDIVRRNNVHLEGRGARTVMLAHGFGCDQTMWRYLTPRLSAHFRLVLFDYVGSGGSQMSAFDPQRYGTLEGYAKDILDICRALELQDVILVGHSVSSIIGLLAAQSNPAFFSRLVLICPSPCFLNIPPDYSGGFEREDLQELLDLMEKNYLGWASFMAPLVMGPEAPPDLVDELNRSFCATDVRAARAFARATFLSDYRHILGDTRHPALILQSETDTLAQPNVGRYMHEHMPGSTFSLIQAEGHCLHMTHAAEVAEAIIGFCHERGG
ncbi:alpha/beta hydrolase [Marinobacter sp. HL-58]|uniref:alpha/beta fold hydrolase n=1 Tax=Marinobacter sp. HL-58 TaxID=1479237 RepID=UPI0005639075|nr:alpha/beta hydrolase [Marinobacter sp. HL-58]KPP97660.1 MAG: putative hydrolases or acyltransferases (alpha/beta hydrolase superfamily) [Marinobacter sp. HL-58]